MNHDGRKLLKFLRLAITVNKKTFSLLKEKKLKENKKENILLSLHRRKEKEKIENSMFFEPIKKLDDRALSLWINS